MSSGIGRELLGAARDAVQEVVWEQTDREVSRIQIMDITRAAAALFDANVEEETIKASVQILGFAAKRGLQVHP